MGSKYKFLPSPATGFLTKDDTRKYFSRFGFAIFALSAGSSLAAYFINWGVQVFFPFLLSYGIYSHILSLVCIYGIGLPIFLLISRKLPRISPMKTNMNVSQIFGSFCVASLMTMIGNYISTIIIMWYATMSGASLDNPLVSMVESSSIWVTLAFSVIIAPILEELVFRKIVCDRLTALGEGYAILLSASAFSLIHGNFFQFAYAFLLGLLFGLIYVKTGRLIYSTVLHITVNFVGLIVSEWLTSLVDMEKLLELLESQATEIPDDMFNSLLIILGYDAIVLIFNIIAIVMLSKVFKQRTLKFESGILPPPQQGKVGNVFMSVGIAVALAYFVLEFALTLLAPMLATAATTVGG